MKTKLITVFVSTLFFAFPTDAAGVHIKDTLDIVRMGSDTPADMLRGKVSGVRVSASDGGLNSIVNTYVRGITSRHVSSEPLWIVDGVCLTTSLSLNEDAFWQSSYEGRSFTQQLNPLSFINPGDIESIEVLKDATATALYGSRGANGVIIIKTKEAKERGHVDINAGMHIPYSGEDTRISPIHNYNISTSGKKNNNQYRVSVALASDSGVIPGEEALRGNLDVRFDSKASKVVWFGLSSIVGVGKTGSQYGTAHFGSPSAMIAARLGQGAEGYFRDYDDENLCYRTATGAYLQLNLVKSLTWRTEFGADYLNSTRYIWYGNQTAFGKEVNGAAAITNSSVLQYNVTSRVDYNVFLGVKHHLNPTVGVEYFGSVNKYNTLNGTDFFSHILRAKGLSFNEAKPELRRFDFSAGDLGLFARLAYDYDGIAGIDLLCRMDNNRRYDDGRFTVYPSGTAFVDFHRLFFQDRQIVSALSLNGGWGMSGRDRYIPYELVGNFYDGFRIGDMQEGTESLYEIRTQQICSEWNVGVQAAFLSDRLRFEARYYDRQIDDRCTSFCFGRQVGETIRWKRHNRVKIGEGVERIAARGVEVDLSGSVIRKAGMTLDLEANLAYQENSASYEYMSAGLNPFPKLFGGLGISFTAKRFGAQVLFDGAWGQELLNLNRMYEDRATDPSEYIENAGFLRLGTVGVHYMIPVGLKWLDSIRLKLMARNLFVATPYSGYSPDVDCYSRVASQHGLDYGSFPLCRTVMFGVSIQF